MIGKPEVYPTLIGNLSKSMSFALLISDCNKSVARTKSSGDKGSPCPTPPPLFCSGKLSHEPHLIKQMKCLKLKCLLSMKSIFQGNLYAFTLE
jgi:hypothetical protein